MLAALACAEHNDRRRNRLGQHNAILGAIEIGYQHRSCLPRSSTDKLQIFDNPSCSNSLNDSDLSSKALLVFQLHRTLSLFFRDHGPGCVSSW